MNITKTKIQKVIKTIDAGLCAGLGNPKPGEMCVEAAVCFGLGLPHSDKPKCAGATIRNFKIALNDSRWSSNAARAIGMRRLAVAQIGSDTLDQKRFSQLLSLRVAQKLMPTALRDFEQDAKPEFKEHILNIAAQMEAAKTQDESDDSLASLASLARLASLASLDSLASLASLVRLASLARLDSLDSLASLARLDSLDNFLTKIADVALGVLIEMKSPGCEFLYLCEEKI